jgi:hypothetical protein
MTTTISAAIQDYDQETEGLLLSMTAEQLQELEDDKAARYDFMMSVLEPYLRSDNHSVGVTQYFERIEYRPQFIEILLYESEPIEF